MISYRKIRLLIKYKAVFPIDMETDVTIAMPVYKRTAYFRQALDSALAQTVPVKIVVHDASPTDVGFREIIGEDSGRVEYYHFTDGIGNARDWNRCMGLIKTKWVSFLHDDDLLFPNSIELLLDAKREMPGRALYFGLDDSIDEKGNVRISKARLVDHHLVEIPPEVYAIKNQFCAAGALFNREIALALGGFPRGAGMTLDWDLWVRLTLHSGAVRTNAITAQYREYTDPNRSTSIYERSGDKLVKIRVQLKRNLARLRRKFPDYVPPPNPGSYIYDMARGDLCTQGHRLTPKGRRICFAYVLRGQRQIHGGRKLAAYLSALYLSWLWIAYSYIRTYRLALRKRFGRRAL
jgi:glycosyltransferase involved in cell wall biosynthesis